MRLLLVCGGLCRHHHLPAASRRHGLRDRCGLHGDAQGLRLHLLRQESRRGADHRCAVVDALRGRAASQLRRPIAVRELERALRSEHASMRHGPVTSACRSRRPIRHMRVDLRCHRPQTARGSCAVDRNKRSHAQRSCSAAVRVPFSAIRSTGWTRGLRWMRASMLESSMPASSMPLSSTPRPMRPRPMHATDVDAFRPSSHAATASMTIVTGSSTVLIRTAPISFASSARCAPAASAAGRCSCEEPAKAALPPRAAAVAAPRRRVMVAVTSRRSSATSIALALAPTVVRASARTRARRRSPHYLTVPTPRAEKRARRTAPSRAVRASSNARRRRVVATHAVRVEG
jgi:hypothetical protein